MDKKLLENRLDVLSKQYEETDNQDVLDLIEKEFLSYLKDNPQDDETWIRLAIFVNQAPLADFNQAIKYLEQLLARDSQNVRALVVLADIQSSVTGGIDEKTFNLLSAIQADDNELMSMVEYAKSIYYRLDNEKKYEECLARSVSFYSKYVHNNEELGKIYLKKGKVSEGSYLIGQALKGVTCIFPETYMYFTSKIFRFTTVDNFIAEFVTGTRSSYDHVKHLGELYLKYHPQK